MKRKAFEFFFNKTVCPLAQGICDKNEGVSFISNFDGLYEEYLNQRTLLRMLVKNTHANSEDEDLLDRHKVAACITTAVMKIRLLYKENLEDKDHSLLDAHRMNEQLAFLCGLNVIISFMAEAKPKIMNIKKTTEFRFPSTRYQNDQDDQSEFIDSMIRGLYYSNVSPGFPTLLLSNIFFLLEEYHKLSFFALPDAVAEQEFKEQWKSK